MSLSIRKYSGKYRNVWYSGNTILYKSTVYSKSIIENIPCRMAPFGIKTHPNCTFTKTESLQARHRLQLSPVYFISVSERDNEHRSENTWAHLLRNECCPPPPRNCSIIKLGAPLFIETPFTQKCFSFPSDFELAALFRSSFIDRS